MHETREYFPAEEYNHGTLAGTKKVSKIRENLWQKCEPFCGETKLRSSNKCCSPAPAKRSWQDWDPKVRKEMYYMIAAILG